jgi:hypothetical protein
MACIEDPIPDQIKMSRPVVSSMIAALQGPAQRKFEPALHAHSAQQ